MNHTVIERDDTFLMAYREWFDSSACKDKCSWLMNQFELYKSLPKEVDKSLRFLINQIGQESNSEVQLQMLSEDHHRSIG